MNLERSVRQVRVYLTMPSRSLSRSTDREYIYSRFTRLAAEWPLSFRANDYLSFFLANSARHIRARALSALGRLEITENVLVKVPIPADVDVVFSYGIFPALRDTEREQIPVVWEQTFAPPNLDINSTDWLRALRRARGRAVTLASRIVTATTVSSQYFREAFPEHAAKVSTIPYYLPDVEAISPEGLERKQTHTDPIRLLFVGKQAIRKGLDTFVKAWSLLDASTRRHLRVKVVSAMIDGRVTLPFDWQLVSRVANIHEEMAHAHVLVFPTKHEAFGLVLVEALANGCIPVTTTAPIQSSIVGNDVGVFADPRDPLSVAQALEHLVANRPNLAQRMHEARERFLSCYHHERVGYLYAKLLREAATEPQQRQA